MSETILVIPCFNEAERLNIEDFRGLANSEIQLLFVDDGSSDKTLELLEQFADECEFVQVLALSQNQGKSEAVRQGLLHAIARSPKQVGFADADLATPVDELRRLCSLSSTSDFDAVIASRIAYLGTQIDREFSRHILGRIFATAASYALGQPVYDTQCGAKCFRVGPALEKALATPFSSRWAFDVEFLGRLFAEGARVKEMPLQKWIDVPGSKIGLKSMLKAGIDLVEIRRKLKSLK